MTTPPTDHEAPGARLRIAIVATHPIQHFVPFYRALSLDPSLQVHVFFASRIGLDEYFDREMNVTVKWRMDLTSGYDHTFLPGADRIHESSFFKMNNLSLGAALDRFRPDAVVVYGYSNITALGTILGAILRRIPLLLISDSELLRERTTAIGWIKDRLLPILGASVFAVLTVGDRNEQYWTRFGVKPGRLFRTPFTIDETLYRDTQRQRDALRRAWRAEHAVGQDEVVFLAVGKLSNRKRQADVLAALRIAAKAGPLRVVLAGDGADRAALEAQAAEAGLPVTFLGFVNVDALPSVYAAADVLVHASSSDPHPLVFSEAACVGLPIIASDRIGAVGPTDIARVGENAVIYPVGDVERLAAAMTDLASDAALRAAMSEASLRIFDTQQASVSVNGLRTAARAAMGLAPSS